MKRIVKKKKGITNINKFVYTVREDTNIKENLEQSLIKNSIQRVEIKFYKDNSIHFNELNVDKKVQDAHSIEETMNRKELKHEKDMIRKIEKTINRNVQSDKNSKNNQQEEKGKNESTPGIKNVINIGKDKTLTDSEDKYKFIEIEKEKKEDQIQKEEKVKKISNRNYNKKNQIELFLRKGKQNKQQEEKEDLQKWIKSNKILKVGWNQKNAQSKSIYKRYYNDKLNEHLPTTVFVSDYCKQFFYCVKKNNLICLSGIINKLKRIGLTIQDILKFRNKLGDTLLIFYVLKRSEIDDIVRFLLLQRC
ncbi:MAG: hypothetical protein LKM44_00755 [Wolbachia endosymbiont of Meromenopon meropis]|nr:hypothetical protein [Wolbachia endosymbiont of Meromenopon meropis]